jgi:hypothetical protein
MRGLLPPMVYTHNGIVCRWNAYAKAWSFEVSGKSYTAQSKQEARPLINSLLERTL